MSSDTERAHPGDRHIPCGHQVERTTATWTRETVPKGLLAIHQTAVWARLVVEAGFVDFHELDESHEPWHGIAAPGQPVVIVPRRKHRIVPSCDARFCVEFYVDAAPASMLDPQASA